MVLVNQFKDNYFRKNLGKCHLLVTHHGVDVSIMVDNHLSGEVNRVNLGLQIDNKLNFNAHVTTICNKVSSKIYALARVLSFMSSEKLIVLFKAFIKLQFGYCPLIWTFHRRKVISRIN